MCQTGKPKIACQKTLGKWFPTGTGPVQEAARDVQHNIDARPHTLVGRLGYMMILHVRDGLETSCHRSSIT